jgi:hypothetical protein
MHNMTIDLQAHPDLQFRIDAFSVPAASRPDFEAAMRRPRCSERRKQLPEYHQLPRER